MKPNWGNAPDWANYWAMDNDYRSVWFENKPTCGAGHWFETTGRFLVITFDGWSESLQERPK